jgi:hypothetical protein
MKLIKHSYLALEEVNLKLLEATAKVLPLIYKG